MNKLLACLLTTLLLAGCLANNDGKPSAKTAGCAQGIVKPWPGTGSGTLCVHQQYTLNGDWTAIEQDFSTLKAAPPSSQADSDGWVAAWQQAAANSNEAYRSLRAGLAELQMDSIGQPTWPELEQLSEEATALKEGIDEPYRAQLSHEYGAQARDVRSHRLSVLAGSLPMFAGGALVASGLAFGVALRWKKRTEYYRPYASKRSFAPPELVLAIVGFSVLVMSLVVALVLGLPAILRSLMVVGGP